MKKVQIHEFNPVIYPIRLYIAYTDNLQAVLENFISTDDEVLEIDWCNGIAYSYRNIINKETKASSFLIVFKSKKKDIPIITHEATHIARRVWEFLGEEITGIEADAYLVEWIVKCCLEIK